MVRRCERPGCGEPADVGYGIDAEHLTVWIEPLDPSLPERPGVLCRRHADSMVVPLRWTLDDRRDAVPRLFRTPTAAEGPARPKPPRATRARPLGVQLALDGAPLADVAGEPTAGESAGVDEPSTAEADDVADDSRDTTPEPEATGAPWRPVFDPDDDLDCLLHATSPLLSRAFNGRDRNPSPGH